MYLVDMKEWKLGKLPCLHDLSYSTNDSRLLSLGPTPTTVRQLKVGPMMDSGGHGMHQIFINCSCFCPPKRRFGGGAQHPHVRRICRSLYRWIQATGAKGPT